MQPKSPQSPKDDAATTALIVQPGFDYDFSIEMMKIQLTRIVVILSHLKAAKKIVYFLDWRDPKFTLFVYIFISWISLVEPESALIFYLAILGKLLLRAHPSYLDFVAELVNWKDTMVRFLTRPFSRCRTVRLSKMVSMIGIDDRSRSGIKEVEYRVFECQRRKIANVVHMLATMVKAPASVAVAAAMQLEDQLESKSETPKNMSESMDNAMKDIQDLFMSFSSKNLKPDEAEWVGPNGVPLDESPATIMHGIKIKWSVQVDKSNTDQNGWEFGKNYPPLVHDSESSIVYDKRDTLWGFGQFVNKLKLHRHWVRRRVWIGTPIRVAFDSEDPIFLSELIKSLANDKEAETEDDEKKSISFYAKYKMLMKEGKKLQRTIFEIASKLESLKNLVSWKAKWISSMFFWILMLLLVLAIHLPQQILVWLFLTLMLVDRLSDVKKKQDLMAPFLTAVADEIDASSIPILWKQQLRTRLRSYYTKIEDITFDFSASIVLNIFQRACNRNCMSHVHLSLADFTDVSGGKDTGGAVTVGMILEKIYINANNGNEDWWKSVKTTIHPKNLFQGHLVSDWGDFNPSSLFSK